MDPTRQSIIDHLEELRFRIIWSLLAILVAFIPGVFLAKPALNALIRFACPEGVTLNYIKPMELFFTELELALLFAVMLSLPIISFQIWRFVAPALYRHERRMIINLSGASCFLFLLGVAFAICFVFPAIMRFSVGMQTESIKPELIIDSFVSLAISLSLGFGIMFQLPILVCVLVSLGVVRLESMRKLRPLVVTIIFVLAAILTPPDVISQLTLGIPTWLLFEGSLLFCRKLDRKREERERLQREEEEREEREAQAQARKEEAHKDALPQETAPAPDDQPQYPEPDDVTDDLYDYTFTAAAKTVKVRNLTPGKHGGRRTRQRLR